MADLSKGSVREKASADIMAEWRVQNSYDLTEDIPYSKPIDASTMSIWVQPDQDIYFNWASFPQKVRSTPFALETFEDNSVGGWVAGVAGYSLDTLAVDGNSLINGTYSLQVADNDADTDNRAHNTTALTFVANRVYKISFWSYSTGIVSDTDYLQFRFFPGTTTPGTATAGTYYAVSGELISSIPSINQNGRVYYEFLFVPSASATGYIHIVFANSGGSTIDAYFDDIRVDELEGEYKPYSQIDTTDDIYLYGGVLTEMRVPLGESSINSRLLGESQDVNDRKMYLNIQRKFSGNTEVRFVEA